MIFVFKTLEDYKFSKCVMWRFYYQKIVASQSPLWYFENQKISDLNGPNIILLGVNIFIVLI